MNWLIPFLLLSTQAQAELLLTDKTPPGDFKPTGDHVLLAVHGQNGSKIDPELKKKLEDHALAWLTARGYKRERELKKSHVMLDFAVHRQPHQPRGEEQELILQAYSYDNGKPPMLVTARALRESRSDARFLDDEKLVLETMDKLLVDSIVGKVEKAPAPTSAEPGCWYILGILFDTKPMRDGMYFVTSLMKGSAASLVGLKKLDQVTEIDGKPITRENFPPKLKKGDEPKLTFIRNYEKKSVSVPVMYHCSDDRQKEEP